MGHLIHCTITFSSYERSVEIAQQPLPENHHRTQKYPNYESERQHTYVRKYNNHTYVAIEFLVLLYQWLTQAIR